VAKGKSYNPLLKTYPDSEKINAISEGAEVLYVRLIAASDDAGRYYGDPEWVLTKLFTARMIQKRVSVKDVEKRLAELSTVGLIRLYDVAGKRYLELVDVIKSLRTDVHRVIVYPEPTSESVTNPIRAVPDSKRDVPETVLQPNQHQPTLDPTQPNPMAPFDPAQIQLPDSFQTDQFRAVWSAFCKLRRRLRKPLDEEQAAAQIAKLIPLGHDNAVRCIESSNTNGYQGLFPEKFSNAQRPGQSKINASAGSQYREGGPKAADHGKF
jgi:hypothetical protein